MQTAESLRVISNKSKVIQQDPSVNKVTFGYKQKCFSKPPNSPPPPNISEVTQPSRYIVGIVVVIIKFSNVGTGIIPVTTVVSGDT